MNELNSSESLIIDDYETYENLIFGIFDCMYHGDKLVVYKEEDKQLSFVEYQTFFKISKKICDKDILYVSRYIQKDLDDDEELDNIIDEIIEDMKEKANIHIKKFELEPIGLLSIAPYPTPIIIRIIGVLLAFLTLKYLLFR